MSKRLDVRFQSGETDCAAWLYLPEGTQPCIVVILGHGLGGTREMRLSAYAERFCAAGYACLVFDYRYFGASGGQPRQVLDIECQLQDWAAAIAFCRTRSELRPESVVLWGTSFGGGHVIVAAARDGRVAAVISQCPFTDGPASMRTTPPGTALKIGARAVRDLVGARFGKPPVMVPLAGPAGSTALMTTSDTLAGYLALLPPNAPFRNEVAARIGLHIGRYMPGRSAADVRCPILFCICETDSVAPASAAQRHARTAPHAEIQRYPFGHFDIYVGAAFERAVTDQLAFLQRHVASAETNER